MRKFLLSVAAALALWGSGQAQISPDAYQRWYGGKYSMFIHFGLYSELGGVWEGKPVTAGYSEQIQSFAGIFSDWYGETALRFNPTRFNADEIVALAKEAGMRSIVITTKHHDGFCMFRTATTDYNSWEATPAPRDFVKELADACRRGGLRLGLYYSNIDWHFPQAYPISSHNCDFVTPEHFELSKAQIRELLTNYGPISELWFDMGSHTPEQSREMYNLVHELQPDCMVSGRLGNDAYDFSVMADNKYPESALQVAWQTAASMFDETWSYRSWQERGSLSDKVNEKLLSLVNVISRGGNYLLNIGPRGDGSVVAFERDALLRMGAWVSRYAEARETLAQVQAAGGSGEILPFDVSNREQTAKVLEAWKDTHPEAYIEVLVNNAGLVIGVDKEHEGNRQQRRRQARNQADLRVLNNHRNSGDKPKHEEDEGNP